MCLTLSLSSRDAFPLGVLAQFQWSIVFGQWAVSSHHQHLLLPDCQRHLLCDSIHGGGQEPQDQHGEGGREGGIWEERDGGKDSERRGVKGEKEGEV